MNNFGTLYRFELKKLMQRKLLWVSLLICLVVCGFSAFSALIGKHYVDGKLYDTYYHMFQVDQGYSRALSGRAIDQQLLEETFAAYGKIPPEAERYQITQEYQTYARPYSPIMNYTRNYLGGGSLEEVMLWKVDEADLYASRLNTLEDLWSRNRLSETEKNFWRQQEAKIEKPVVYVHSPGYNQMVDCLSTVAVLALLFISIGMAGVFFEEHTRRTDQLTLSTANGKVRLYWAKLLAGTTVAGGGTLLMMLTVAGLSLGIYGAEGSHAALQLYFWVSSYPLTVLQACLIGYGIVLLIAVFFGVFVMVLSEALRSNIGALSISVGLVVLGGMVTMPEGNRLLAQIWDYLPMCFLVIWNLFDIRLVTVFGRCMTSWQFVPVCYMLAVVLLVLAGKRVYQRYQVSGR